LLACTFYSFRLSASICFLFALVLLAAAAAVVIYRPRLKRRLPDGSVAARGVCITDFMTAPWATVATAFIDFKNKLEIVVKSDGL